ncbi:MAG: hypothetical protein EOO20_13485, partial [Chryseobacterium sp.]
MAHEKFFCQLFFFVKVFERFFREVFEDALEAEIAITQSFKNLASRCHKEQDFVTMEFLN